MSNIPFMKRPHGSDQPKELPMTTTRMRVFEWKPEITFEEKCQTIITCLLDGAQLIHSDTHGPVLTAEGQNIVIPVAPEIVRYLEAEGLIVSCAKH